MVTRTRNLLLRAAAPGLVALALLSIGGAGEAQAHVKWFCAFDVAGQPRGLENVLCTNFEVLVGLAMVALFAGCLLERTFVGDALLRSFDRATAALHSHTEIMFRVGIAGFLIGLWALGGVLLTPELKTTWAVIPWIQLAMAACLISRRTMPVTAFGICACSRSQLTNTASSTWRTIRSSSASRPTSR